MTKITFKFSKEKDIWNNWDKSNKSSLTGPFKVPDYIKKECEGKSLEEATPILEKNLEKIHNSPLIGLQIEALEKGWKLVEKNFFERMNKLMKNEYPEEITGYLTTISVCPYNYGESWFMFSFFSPIVGCLSTSGHEIMHLYFHKFYWDSVEKELGYDKTWHLKEALTVLLNLEFRDLWFARDEGKIQHKELREFISEEWKKEKDFEILLQKCILYMKNMEI